MDRKQEGNTLANKLMIYWYGCSTEKLPQELKQRVSHLFSLKEMGDDISELTHPDVSLIFLYVRGLNFHSLLKSALTICTNLNKFIVIFHDGINLQLNDNSACVLKVIDVSDKHSFEYIDDLHLVITPPQQPLTEEASRLQPLQIGVRSAKQSKIVDVIEFIDSHLTEKLLLKTSPVK